MRTSLLGSFALVTSITLASSASAKPNNAAPPPAPVAPAPTPAGPSAADLKEQGDFALGEKRYADALADYEAAYAQNPTPALLYNRGRALQFLARYPEALDLIEQFAQKAPPDLLAKVRGLPELLAELRSRVSTLTLNCSIVGARVLVGQKQVAVTPLTAPLKLNAGPQPIDVFADGYFPYHRDQVLPGGGALSLDVTLASRDTSGLLVVKSTLSGVQVRVDDKSLGLAPAEVGLGAGTHRIDVEKDGFGDGSSQIVLHAGERKELTLDPVARTPIYARWWFWTGVGIVAAGVVTTVIVLSTEKSAPSGDFSPGQVRF